VPLLVGEREWDEAEQVDHEDEEHQRRDVREPAVDALCRQSLLGHLRLRDLVDLLAECLRPPAARAHQRHADDHRQDRPEDQVGDCLGDREVERAEMDRDPRMLLELLGRVELPLRERHLWQS
jgi:hypothetical protein